MALHFVSKFLLLGTLKRFWNIRMFSDKIKKGLQEDGKILRSLNKVGKRINLEEGEKDQRRKTIQLEGPVDASLISGVPEELRNTRIVRIFRPTKNPLQSGTCHIGHWEIDFDPKERWENPNMGWCSTGDPLSNTTLKFSTKEEAVDYCERSGWKWYEFESCTNKQFRPKRSMQIFRSRKKRHEAKINGFWKKK